MKQSQFESENSALWQEIEALVANKAANQALDRTRLPTLYRRLCQCLALSGQRGYAPQLTEYLHRLVLDCHQLFYGAAVERPFTLHQWLGVEFPRRVREEWRLLLFVNLVFWGVALVVGLMVWINPDWAYSFSSAKDLESMRDMYKPHPSRAGRGGSGGDIEMFGFYIWNNVSITFRTFASGLFGGIPALFSVGLNGMHLGVVAAWLSLDSTTRLNFWSFVVTHASFEITGLLLAGLAGMRMGLALIKPGRMTRRQALGHTGEHVFPIVVGAAILTLVAAFFEGFWSASGAAPMVKFVVGGVCWAIVILFFCVAGRRT
jgi:uncharacterized membrane protein SpoIIM required for sporulation